MRYRLINFFSILIILVFLIILSQRRNSKNKMLNLKIDFKDKKGRFLDPQMVNKLLIQRNDSKFLLREDMVDLKIFEDLLTSNPMIASANIFRTPQGILNIKIEERKPIVRIINDREEFYLDNFGIKVPLSSNYSARVPIFYGQFENKLIELVNFVKLFSIDSFTKDEVIDFRNFKNTYIIGLRSFPFKVIWGNSSKYSQKVKKLKYLYSYLEGKDFLKIEKVNLTFDKQIVLDYGQNR